MISFCDQSASCLPFIPAAEASAKIGLPEKWLALARWLRSLTLPEGRPRLLVVGGEADAKALAAFRPRMAHGERGGRNGAASDVLFAENLPLPCVGALLARCRLFIGHDSGISHLAAAVGAPGRAAVWPD